MFVIYEFCFPDNYKTQFAKFFVTTFEGIPLVSSNTPFTFLVGPLGSITNGHIPTKSLFNTTEALSINLCKTPSDSAYCPFQSCSLIGNNCYNSIFLLVQTPGFVFYCCITNQYEPSNLTQIYYFPVFMGQESCWNQVSASLLSSPEGLTRERSPELLQAVGTIHFFVAPRLRLIFIYLLAVGQRLLSIPTSHSQVLAMWPSPQFVPSRSAGKHHFNLT